MKTKRQFALFLFMVLLYHLKSTAQSATGYTESFSPSGILGADYFTNRTITGRQWQADFSYAEKWFVDGQGVEQTLLLDSLNMAMLKIDKPAAIPQNLADIWFSPRKFLDLRNYKYFTVKIRATVPVYMSFDILDNTNRRYGKLQKQRIEKTDKTITLMFNQLPLDSTFDFSKVTSLVMNVANQNQYSGTIYFSDLKFGDKVLNGPLQLSATTTIACNGVSNASASVSVIGGVAPYSYSWNTYPVQTTAQVRNLQKGNYIVKVRDAIGMEDSLNVTLTERSETLVANAGPDQNICEGKSTGLKSIGTGALSYIWYPSLGLSDSIAPSPLARPSATTTYMLVVSDGCSTYTDEMTVFVSPTPTTSAASNSPLCNSDSLKLFSIKGSASATYSWNGPNGYKSTFQNPIIHTPNAADAGAYTVTLTEGSCSSTPSVITVTVKKLTNVIIGQVTKKNGEFLANSKVILIEFAQDSIKLNGDTVLTDRNGRFKFLNPFSGKKYVKVIPDPVKYPTMLPTYNFYALTIQEASIIMPSCDTANIVIVARENFKMEGEGTIEGNIEKEIVANKSARIAATSNPIVTLILIEDSKGPVQVTNTDSNGNFKFTNLPVGTYSIYVDKIGVNNLIAPKLTLSTLMPSQSNLLFILHASKLELKSAAGTNKGNNFENVFVISPNPFEQTTNISYSIIQPTWVTFEIKNLLGETVDNIIEGAKSEGAHHVQYNFNLISGVYFIRCTIGENSMLQKLIVR